MKKILLTVYIIGVISAGLLFAQGKNGVTQTAQAESTPVVAVSTVTADSGAATVESKTVKTEIQSPGVVTEYKEDGTKVVTINLSEVDENKLPEKYEAKVILEAPILELDYIKANKAKLEKKVYFAYLNDDDLKQDIDVKIDENGFIYIFDPYMGRIQKFNSDGKHLIDIPFDNTRKAHLQGDHWIADSMIDEFEVYLGEIYIINTIKNTIEKIDEKGRVKQKINIPEKSDGQSAREAIMYIDPSDIIKRKDLQQNTDNLKGSRNTLNVMVKEIYPTVFNVKSESCEFRVVQNSPSVKSITFIYIDRFQNVYFKSVGMKGNERGFYKVSPCGKMLGVIRDWKYRVEDKWRDDCENRPEPLLMNWQESMIFNKDGDLYFFENICCKNQINCIGMVRVLKVSRRK
ncbi:MAG TPA: hypothetical protein PLB12_03260 [Candidatus Goldiibacteriota bacterium]|nr:hypothetical protein [Candidatus Goldiibacteriota bacterium]